MRMHRRMWTTAIVCWLVTGVAGASDAFAQTTYLLDDTLCLAVNGTLPNYYTLLGPAANPASPRSMLKKTLTGPDSICNDGSPAVMYLRPAPPGSPDADKWIIFLQGGGSCANADECLDRFCSLGTPQVFLVAGKMSSLGAPDAINPPHGILASRPWNQFRGYNHVNVHYCSSDAWSGSAAVKMEQAALAGYNIQFHGEAIVNDVFDTLRSGPTWPDSGGQNPMPDLDAASLVLFTGESAGANGVKHHLDRMAAKLATVGVAVGGVTDASLPPGLFSPAISWAAAPYANYDDMASALFRPKYRDFWETDDSALDASCLASGVADYYCMDNVYTQLNEISTPTFARQDLTDSLQDHLFAWGIFTNTTDYANATAGQLWTLPATSGWFGPNCGGHVTIQTRGFERTEAKFGSGLVFQDLLRNWVRGVGLTRELQVDPNPAPPYTRSRLCY